MSSPAPERTQAPPASRREAVTGKKGNFLTRKLGPFPTWVWIVIVGGIIVAWAYYQSRTSSSTSTTGTTAGQVPEFVNQTFTGPYPPTPPQPPPHKHHRKHEGHHKYGTIGTGHQVGYNPHGPNPRTGPGPGQGQGYPTIPTGHQVGYNPPPTIPTGHQVNWPPQHHKRKRRGHLHTNPFRRHHHRHSHIQMSQAPSTDNQFAYTVPTQGGM